MTGTVSSTPPSRWWWTLTSCPPSSIPRPPSRTALRESEVVVERRIVNHRIAGTAIEPRGCVADWRTDSVTLWSSTQIPHLVRLFLAGELGVSEERIRVVAPEVGGGFGTKLNHYGEEVLACYLSRRLGRPVKWLETRTENLGITTLGRDLICYCK